MVDNKSNPNDTNQPETGEANTNAGQLQPGESNARAVRNPDKPAGGTAARTATSTSRSTSGQTDTSSEQPAGETTRVRMTRDADGHTNGQELDLPKDEADRLVNDGAAERVGD